jgi:hypothetical protein
MPRKKYKIAVLDDYQNVGLANADWSVLRDRRDIAVFQDHWCLWRTFGRRAPQIGPNS